jgi:hypothetical protein
MPSEIKPCPRCGGMMLWDKNYGCYCTEDDCNYNRRTTDASSKTVECCDNCKREFEPFDVNGLNKIDGENFTGKGYGFVIKEGDVEVLMSDLEFAFCCFVEPTPEREKDEWQYWCVKCVEGVFDDVK